GLIETVPLTRVPKIRQVETIPADVLQPGKRCIEFWSDGIRAIGAEALDEPILVPVPLPGNVNGVVEGCGLNPGQITRLEYVGDEPLASRRTAVFSASGGLGWPRWRAQTHCPLLIFAPSRGCSCSCPTFPRSRASWLASEGRIALWASCEQHQAADFPAGTGRHGRLHLSDR